MPNYWYDNPRFIMSGEDDGEAEMERAAFNARISAYRKPYFMIYVYPKLKKDYLDYVGKSESKSEILFGLTMDELQESEDEDATAFLNSYFTYLPVGKNKCVVNRICEIFENEFDSWSAKRPDGSAFDYSILKSGVEYSHKDYVSISEIYNDYLIQINNFHNRTRIERMDKFEAFIEKQTFVDTFRYRCSLVCPNRYELCDIMLDICYDRENGKRFVWDVCGDVIIDNLLAKNNHEIHFPVVVDEDGDFEYGGQNFEMHSMILCEDTEDE